MTKKTFTFAVLFTAFVLALLSQTIPSLAQSSESPILAPCNVSGLIGIDTVWSPTSCDYYVVTGNIIVQSGVTLSIMPGTTVKFDSGKAMTIQGRLVAAGESGNLITFTSNAPQPFKGDWGYIQFTDTSIDDPGCGGVGSLMYYTVVEYGGGTAISDNGAIRIQDSSPCLNHNIIRHNEDDGIHSWGNGLPRILNNTLDDNGTGSIQGAGIYIYTSNLDPVEIVGNVVSGNTEQGISVISRGGTISYNQVLNNNEDGSSVNGGGLLISGFNSGGSMVVDNNLISGNQGSSGGGIYIQASALLTMLTNNTIIDNAASSRGGGAYLYPSSFPITLIGNTVSNNTASDGGGIYMAYSLGATLETNIVSGNIAASEGGGIYFSDFHSSIITSTQVSGNTAGTAGGGMYVRACSNASFDHNVVTQNQLTDANGKGGGIYLLNNCRPIVNDNDICDNLDAYNGDVFNDNLANTPDIDLQNNYWGYFNSGGIEDQIWHFVDDAALSIADYVPFRLTPASGNPYVCSSLPPCTLDLSLSYDGSQLTLDYDLFSGPEPVYWANYINVQGAWHPLWQVGLPEGFTLQNGVSFPFGSMGTVKVYTQLHNANGVACSDFQTIETVDGNLVSWPEVLQQMQAYSPDIK